MPDETIEVPALLIIDMVKDNFDESKHLPITPHARKIIAPINRMIRMFREKYWPIVFSTDAFHPQDFIFTSRMHPHSLAGTEGAEVIDELNRREEDLWLPKPKFSAFFQTGLEKTLHAKGVTLCAVAGISTNICVLSTVLDALCHNFKAVLLEDCTAAFSPQIHQQTLALYKRNLMYPLLKVSDSGQMVSELIGVLKSAAG